MMKFNAQRIQRDRIQGYGEGGVSKAETHKKVILEDGNHVLMDKEGRVYNVHPQHPSVKDVYPIRWQISKWDLTDEMKAKLGVEV